MLASALTIAVATYNLEHYLTDCLDSIAAQSMQGFRLLIVDDGSTDRTVALGRAFCGAHPEMKPALYEQENSGLAVSRNNALAHCETDFIWFIDGDDMLSPHSVETLCKSDAESCDVACFLHRNFGTPEQAQTQPARFLTGDELKHLCYKNMMRDELPSIEKIHALSAWSKLYNVGFLRKNGLCYSVKLRKTQDLVFNANVFSCARSVLYIPAQLYLYRPNPSSISMRYTAFTPSVYLTLLTELQTLIADKYEDDAHMQALYSERVVWCVRECLRLCFFHAQNPASYRQRRAASIAYLQTPLIRTELAKCPRSRLRAMDRTIIFLLDHRLYRLLELCIRTINAVVGVRLRREKPIYKD